MFTIEQRDEFAIAFANWIEKLSPAQKVSAWSKNGEYRGLFTMDNEQLLSKYKKEKEGEKMKLEITEEEAIGLYKKGILKEKLEECYPKLKKKFVEKWEDLGTTAGFWIDINSDILESAPVSANNSNKNISSSKQLLESHLAETQLSQILYDYYGENTEDWVDWKDKHQTKWYIYVSGEKLVVDVDTETRKARLYFKTREDAEQSIELHKSLWLQYFGVKEEK